MSHIVIHDDSAGVTQYDRFDDVRDAVAHIEQLHNVDGVGDARLFALHEVPLSVRSYVKVEIGDEASAGDDRTTDRADDSWSRSVEVASEVDDDPWDDAGVEYVDASTIDAELEVGPEPDDAPGLVSEPRRGLFGR